MTEKNKQRAEEVAARPDVRRWIKRLERLGRDMPKDVWVFVASGTPTVMVTDEDGGHCATPGMSGNVDRDGIIQSGHVRGSWDGGDW